VGTRLGAIDTGASPLVYIGTTTRKAGDGIYVGRWNHPSGTLSEVRIAFGAISPSFLAVTRHRKVPLLFAGHQTAPQTGGLSGFRIDPSGDLKLLNTLPATGADFVHLALDHTEGWLIAATYGEGTILSCKVDPDGHLSGFASQIQLTGHGPVTPVSFGAKLARGVFCAIEARNAVSHPACMLARDKRRSPECLPQPAAPFRRR
jgi:6-phosphogluconolactonase (cycloisomerase 2 family)